MAIQYIVMFYHGKEDRKSIARELSKNISGRRTKLILFNSERIAKGIGTANETINNLKEIMRLNAEKDVVEERALNRYEDDVVRAVSLGETGAEEMEETMAAEFNSMVRGIEMEGEGNIVVMISNANPVEAYMVAYLRPLFNYDVYTDKPRETVLPEPLEIVALNDKEYKILECLSDRGDQMTPAELMRELHDYKSIYNQIRKLVKLRLVEYVETEGKKKKPVQITSAGRHALYCNRSRMVMNKGKKRKIIPMPDTD